MRPMSNASRRPNIIPWRSHMYSTPVSLLSVKTFPGSETPSEYQTQIVHTHKVACHDHFTCELYTIRRTRNVTSPVLSNDVACFDDEDETTCTTIYLWLAVLVADTVCVTERDDEMLLVT